MLVAVVIIAVSLLAGGKAGPGHDPYVKARPAPAAISSAVQNVPVSALKAAGNGATTGAEAISPVGKAGSGYPIIPLSGKALTRNGKPLVVYLGAEYCPYCAATRWPLTIALSRFGTFSGLQITASTPLDVYSSTHTLSYATAKYHSQYLTFDSTEELTNICPKGHVIVNTQRNAAQPDWISPPYICNTNYEPLQTPSKAVSQLLSSVDTAANFTTSGASGIPFIDFGGKYAESGSIYSPALLHGADWSQIVASLKAPTRGIGHAVLAAANRYTAILCQVTGDTPASVCDAPFMKSAEKALAPK